MKPNTYQKEKFPNTARMPCGEFCEQERERERERSVEDTVAGQIRVGVSLLTLSDAPPVGANASFTPSLPPPTTNAAAAMVARTLATARCREVLTDSLHRLRTVKGAEHSTCPLDADGRPLPPPVHHLISTRDGFESRYREAGNLLHH